MESEATNVLDKFIDPVCAVIWQIHRSKQLFAPKFIFLRGHFFIPLRMHEIYLGVLDRSYDLIPIQIQYHHKPLAVAAYVISVVPGYSSSSKCRPPCAERV